VSVRVCVRVCVCEWGICKDTDDNDRRIVWTLLQSRWATKHVKTDIECTDARASQVRNKARKTGVECVTLMVGYLKALRLESAEVAREEGIADGVRPSRVGEVRRAVSRVLGQRLVERSVTAQPRESGDDECCCARIRICPTPSITIHATHNTHATHNAHATPTNHRRRHHTTATPTPAARSAEQNITAPSHHAAICKRGW
jgi:hypothetical protein